MTRADRRRARQGSDDSDFDSFYLRHVARIRRFLLRRIQPTDVDDVLEEVFFAAWRHFDQIKQEPSHEVGWLFVTARLQLLNLMRSARRGQRLQTRLAAHELPAIAGIRETGSRESFITDERLAAAFEQLPDDDRFILTLVAWDECTTDELAAMLGCNAAAAKTRLSRARGRFRQQAGSNNGRQAEAGGQSDG